MDDNALPRPIRELAFFNKTSFLAKESKAVLAPKPLSQNPDDCQSASSAAPLRPSSLQVAVAVSVLALALAALLTPDVFKTTLLQLNQLIFTYAGSYYLFFANGVLLLLGFIVFTPLGNLKLGGPDSSPSYSWIGWLAMLLCAGMAGGLLFWGAAEPLYHFYTHPVVNDVTAQQQAVRAFELSFFHWGLHPWGLYCLSAIAVGVLAFEKKQGFWLSSWISNPLGNRWQKQFHWLLNVFTVLAILVGIAASFATAILHLDAGLSTLFPAVLSSFSDTLPLHLILLGILTASFTLSSLSGLKGSIQWISLASVALSFVLAVSIAWLYPNQNLLLPVLQAIPQWFLEFPALSSGNLTFQPADWPREWTIKYWSWWIAWTPFVGMFIALISRGRSLRQIIVAVLLCPTLLSWLWFWFFGKAAIGLQQANHSLLPYLEWDRLNALLFALFKALPAPTEVITLLQGLSVLLIAAFLVNSADSSTYTLSFLDQPHHANTNAPEDQAVPVFKKISWGLLQALTALAFLAGGNLLILQQVTLISALPFTLILSAVFIRLMIYLLQPKNAATHKAS